MNSNRNAAAESFSTTAMQIASNLITETGCTAERAIEVASKWLMTKMVNENPTLAAKVLA